MSHLKPDNGAPESDTKSVRFDHAERNCPTTVPRFPDSGSLGRFPGHPLGGPEPSPVPEPKSEPFDCVD